MLFNACRVSGVGGIERPFQPGRSCQVVVFSADAALFFEGLLTRNSV